MHNSSYRLDDISKKLAVMGVEPLDIMVVGGTGAGKSSTLNTILGREMAAVGMGCNPETMEVISFDFSDKIRLWDSPGLGDSLSSDMLHKEKIIKQLNATYTLNDNRYGLVDMVLLIIEGAIRDMGTAFQLLDEVIIPNIQKNRILVAINQADMAMKGMHWDRGRNCPDNILLAFLEEKANSIQRRVLDSTGIKIIKPVYYSASKNYNISALLDLIVDNIPICKRRLISNVFK